MPPMKLVVMLKLQDTTEELTSPQLKLKKPQLKLTNFPHKQLNLQMKLKTR
jgi:hypothetical protein